MTWLTIKTTLLKVWAWCKKYWQLLVGISIPLIIWIVTRNSDKLSEVFTRVTSDHKAEIAAIDQSHAIETNLTQQAQVKHDTAIAQIEQEHAAANIVLDTKKKELINQIVQDYGDNPDEITRRISALTGIPVKNSR